jgi:hypothetical protein
MTAPGSSGRCLCGAVTYRVSGPLRDVVLCHCVECRRWCGHTGAFAATRREHVTVSGPLRWIDSPESDRHARRGFCGECGSSLFWEPATAGTTCIAAGTIDEPTGLQLAGHWYTHAPGDYHELPDDGLPRNAAATAALSGSGRPTVSSETVSETSSETVSETVSEETRVAPGQATDRTALTMPS